MIRKSFSNLSRQGRHDRINNVVQQELNNLRVLEIHERRLAQATDHDENNQNPPVPLVLENANVNHVNPIPIRENIDGVNDNVIIGDDEGNSIDEHVAPDVIADIEHHNILSDVSDSDAEEAQMEENVQALVTSSSESEAEEIFQEHDRNGAQITFKDFLIQWFYECNINKRALTKLLHGLRRFNQLPLDLPMDARTLLSTPRHGIIPVRMGSGEFHYYGIKRALVNQMALYDQGDIPQVLELDIFVDGLTLSKSSKSELFPTLGKVVNAPVFSEIFIISIYHGASKPDDAHEFMRSFNEEFIVLRDEGFTYNNQIYYVRIRAIIADTVARVFILCFPSHSSRCGKCIQNSRRILDTCVFLNSNAPLRTMLTFRVDLPPEYQNIRSPVEYLVDPLTQVPLDPMHHWNLGVTKKHINIFLTALENSDHDGRVMESLDNDFKSLTKWTPSEFHRKVRSIKEFGHFKATELRTILLYVGPVIFSRYMNSEAMLHFNSLHLAARLLSDPDQCVRNNDFARELLIYYVEQMRYLYGDHMLVYNVHNLLHVCDEVLRFGTLDNFSAIGFEGFLYIIKKMLKNGTNILSQIVNRVNEMAINQIRAKRANREGLLQGRQFMLTKPNPSNILPRGYYSSHENIQFSEFCLTSKVPDNCCYMKDGSIVVISHICRNAQRESVILGKQFLNCRSLDDYTIDTRELGICKSETLSGEFLVSPVTQVHKKAFRMLLDQTFYLFPMLHTHNF
ncbi:hypothetical protein QAD02_008816 [Eretmocerus hayati]|uniref:Uncharacterized protein n=1 Tax=Eretmocerus hayati TaxID=131215 RepID=A0ACC2N7Z1_9HYME|nr:hypothetical protein QAD02_008816 [Eretmocerus hayati]